MAAASQLLQTSFRTVECAATGQRAVRASGYTVPEAVAPAVAAIFGLHGLPQPRRQRSAVPADAYPVGAFPPPPMAPPVNVTPAVIVAAYSVGGVVVDRTAAKARQAVAEFSGQAMNATDLKSWFKEYVPSAQPGDDTVHAFIGDENMGHGGDEASLDIQFLMGMTPGIKTDFYLYESTDFCAVRRFQAWERKSGRERGK